MSTIGIDVPVCDLLLRSDNLVGNIAYISASAPDLIAGAIDRLRRLHRERVIPGHMGVLKGEAPGNARHYLERLRERVGEARRNCAEAVREIRIEDCVVPGVVPKPFEHEWHGRHLDVILERRIFTVPASERSARGLCCG